MALLVRDLAKAHEALLLEAKRAGFVLVTLDGSYEGPEVALNCQTITDFLELAKSLGARAVYVTAREPDPDAAELAAASFRQGKLVPGVKRDRKLAVAFQRTFELIRDFGTPTLHAMFFHEGVFHVLQVADETAWPALQLIDQSDE